MNGKWKRIRPFRIFAVFLGIIALVMACRFPNASLRLERQQEQLEAASQTYLDEQARNNRLTSELSGINSREYIENMARREYDYCWYGETIYEVANLEEIEPQPEFEVYGEDD